MARLLVALSAAGALAITAVAVAASLPSRDGTPDAAAATTSTTASAGYAVVVDKRRPLVPRDYAPTDLVAVRVAYVGLAPTLRDKPARAVEAMFAAFAAQTGLAMQSNSAYRSYADQKVEYARFSRSLGADAAAETTARPGYSEHQTGLAIDVGAKDSGCNARACFSATPQSRWLASNAWRFGFIIRYPRGQEAVTGYTYEPWHLRYVGPGLAEKIHGHYSSLEAYFRLAAAPDY